MRKFLRSAALASLTLLAAPLCLADTQDEEDKDMLEKLSLFGQVLALVQDEYVEPVENSDLINTSINGALESLDPHSHYVPEVEFEERQKSSRREYEGLGIEVAMSRGVLRVNYVTPASPASHAGLKAGDKITEVDGRSLKGKTLDEALTELRGKAGEAITVTVLSEGGTQKELTLTREKIQARAVRHRTVDGLGYIRIETFNNANLDRDVRIALSLLKQELGDPMPGLIIDVRGNPGGMVSQVVKVTGYFLDGGEVFSARGRTVENTQRYNANQGELVKDVPIVVLINSNSASAAEILAGALQDRNRAMIVGRRSFGKGSVQSVTQLEQGGALRLTTQRYYTPSGRSIQTNGIMPDFLTAQSPDEASAKDRFREDDLHNALGNPDGQAIKEDYAAMDFPPEDWPETEDYQLDRAVKVLKTPDYTEQLASRNVLQ